MAKCDGKRLFPKRNELSKVKTNPKPNNQSKKPIFSGLEHFDQKGMTVSVKISEQKVLKPIIFKTYASVGSKET